MVGTLRVKFAIVWTVFAALIGSEPPVTAQISGTISGIVLDESGGVVTGAQVSIVGGPAGSRRLVTTDASGAFSLTGLPPGRHIVQVTRTLFEPARAEAIVGDGPTAPLRITLRVSALREDVTVTARRSTDKLSIDAPALTGSRLGLTPRDTPASVTVVERGTIEQRGATDTQEILSSVPGMVAASPPGSAGAVTYRGFGTSQITQLFNGITVQYDAIAARPVDSWIYDRVEVIGGPSTFLFGAGAVGGSINYVTKLAERDRNGGQARVSYGSYGTTDIGVSGNRRLGGSVVRNTVRGDLSYGHTKGYVDENHRNALTSAVSLITDVGSKVSHTLAFEFQNEAVDRPYWGTPLLTPTIGPGRIKPETRFLNYNSIDGIYEQTVLWGRSITEFRPTRTTSVRNTVYHYDALRDYRNVEVYRYTADNSAVARSSPLLQRHDQRLTGDRVEAQHSGQIGRLQADWAGGLDISYNRQVRFPLSLTSTVSTVDPVTFTTERFFDVPGIVPGFNPDRTNEVSTLAFFVENRTKLHNALSLVAGMRWDRIVLEGTNHRAVSATNPAYFKNTYEPVTGRVGLTYAIAPSANVYAQFSTAADPPAGILTTASFAQVRDFDLTTGRQIEAGSKFDLPGGRGAATVAVFQITRKNLAIADPLNPGTTIPVGQQSSRGLEVASSYRLVPALLVQANYAYVDASFDEFLENVGGVAVSRAGNRPTNTPDHVANLWLTYTIAPAVETGVDARWVSSRFGDTANTLTDDRYAVYGAYVSYRFRMKAVLTGRVRNLTDEVYARSITGTPMFFLGAPRSFELSLRLGF